MKKYCLAYDAINSGQWQGNELKKVIIEILIAAGAVNFETPVASTILFEDETDRNRINYWNNTIRTEFVSSTNRTGKLKNGIYYYICMVAKDVNGAYVERKNADPSLATSLREILSEI